MTEPVSGINGETEEIDFDFAGDTIADLFFLEYQLFRNEYHMSEK